LSIDLLLELDNLDNRVDGLMQSLDLLKAERASFKDGASAADSLRSENEALKGEVSDLRKQLDALKSDADGQREKMKEAAELVKRLIAKVDSARQP